MVRHQAHRIRDRFPVLLDGYHHVRVGDETRLAGLGVRRVGERVEHPLEVVLSGEPGGREKRYEDDDQGSLTPPAARTRPEPHGQSQGHHGADERDERRPISQAVGQRHAPLSLSFERHDDKDRDDYHRQSRQDDQQQRDPSHPRAQEGLVVFSHHKFLLNFSRLSCSLKAFSVSAIKRLYPRPSINGLGLFPWARSSAFSRIE